MLDLVFPLLLVYLAAQVEQDACDGRGPTLTTAAAIREWVDQPNVGAGPATPWIALPEGSEVHIGGDELRELGPVGDAALQTAVVWVSIQILEF